MVDGRRILSAIAVTGLAAVSLWGVIRVVASADLDEQPVQGSSQDSGQRAPDVSEAQGVEVRQERRSSIEADSGRAVDPDAKTMAQCLASHGIQVVQEILAADAPAVLYERLEEKVEAIRDRLGALDSAKLEAGRLQLQVAELRQREMLLAFEEGVYVLVTPDMAMRAADVLSREFRNTNVGTHSGLTTVTGSQVVAVVARRPSAELRKAMAAANRMRRASPK